MDKPFEWNGRFTVKKGLHFFDENMDLKFPVDKGYDCQDYDSCFTGFAHDGIILAPSNENLSLGLRRLTCKRLQDGIGADTVQPDLDHILATNQRAFFASDALKRLYSDIANLFDDYCSINNLRKDTLASEELEDFVMEEHIKAKLRQGALREIYEEGRFVDVDWMKSATLLKCKKYEVSKYKKYIRIIMDLGVHASLQGAQLMAQFKKCINLHEFRYQYTTGRSMMFVFIAKPVIEVLTHYLKMLWFNDTNEDILLVHSDDAMLSFVNESGRREVICCDLKQCDGSQLEPAIEAFFTLLRADDVVVRLKQQLRKDIRIVSTQGERVVLSANGLWFPSGHVMTTSANTCSYFAIACCALMGEGIKNSSHFQAIGKKVGFMIEVVPCSIVQDMQFLKHSLVRTYENDWIATINPGVWMRASGRCFRELPGSKKHSYWERAAEYQALLTYGMIGNVMIPELDGVYVDHTRRKQLQQRGIVEKDLRTLRGYTDKFHFVTCEEVNKRPLVKCSVEEYFARYRLTDAELVELCELISQLDVGYFVYSQAVSKILNMDYGLSCPVE